jgi:LysR family glycine cleavage system transcriptional activator
MKKYRRHLPSLDALVFFEAAARHNSFTRAAGELYVTQAAVSKRIRELEARLGIELFHRDGRRLSLTDSGRSFYHRVSMAMEYLDDACALAAEAQVETIRIAANSAVSLLWLAPRLRAFGLGESSANVSLFTSDNVSDTIDPQHDLVISYGQGDHPGWSSELLFSERLVPVAAPGYLESLGIAADASPRSGDQAWQRCKLLEFERLAPDWINWRLWLERMPDSPLAGCARITCRNYSQAIGAALQGKGLALGSRGLIDDELEAGRLRVLGDAQLETGRAYYLAQPRKKNPGNAARALKRLLMAAPQQP